MVKKQLFHLFCICCIFTLLVCGERNILPNLTNCHEPEPVFWPLGDGAGAAWEKNQEPEPLEKMSGAGAAKKISRLPTPELEYYYSLPPLSFIRIFPLLK